MAIPNGINGWRNREAKHHLPLLDGPFLLSFTKKRYSIGKIAGETKKEERTEVQKKNIGINVDDE